MNKEEIANICENLYRYCVGVIPQIDNNEIIWILNGSVLSNILYNVDYINDDIVSKEFKKCCYEFIRTPKGDIDITYKADREYRFDLKSEQVLKFKSIAKEDRTYNFVDSNSIISDIDLKQICKMTTKDGFTFYAKKPQYIFLYKFKELLACYNTEILNNDITEINNKNVNIINDVINLYNIATNYISEDELYNIIINLSDISSYLNDLKNDNMDRYYELINCGLNIAKNNKIKSI